MLVTSILVSTKMNYAKDKIYIHMKYTSLYAYTPEHNMCICKHYTHDIYIHMSALKVYTCVNWYLYTSGWMALALPISVDL